MSCCIELWTPKALKEDDDIDVFEEIFESTDYENADLMQRALWARYREYAIGSCDLDSWIVGMRDRLTLIGSRWDQILSRLLDTDMTDLTDRAYHRVIKRTAIEGTDGDVRTVARTGTSTNVDTPEGEDVHTMEHESLPQTETSATKYLDARQTDTDAPGVVRTNERTDDLLDTDTYAPNTQDTEDYEEFDTLNAVTFDSMMKAYPDVILGFTDEFAQYFINRWY